MAAKKKFGVRVGYVWVDRFDKPQADTREVELDLDDPVQNRLYETQKHKLEDVESSKRHHQEIEDRRVQGRMMASPMNRMAPQREQRSGGAPEKKPAEKTD